MGILDFDAILKTDWKRRKTLNSSILEKILEKNKAQWTTKQFEYVANESDASCILIITLSCDIS